METITVKTVTIGNRQNRDLLGHAILECIGSDANAKAIIASMKGEKPNQYMEVEFKINGIEVCFSTFINHLDSEVDRMIKQEAYAKIKEDLGGLDDKLYETTKDIDEAIRSIVKNKLGIELREDDDR
jgi:hypothetical protein